MKLLVTSPDFYQSALNFDYKRRHWSNFIVAMKFLEMFSQQPINAFNSPTYKCWTGINFEYTEALKIYYNCLLKVAKEVHHYNTKYNYLSIDVNKLKFPNFTDLTFKSHQAFLINLNRDLYYPKFKENENFNGNFCIWEYPIIKDSNIIMMAEDIHGVYKPEKLDSKFESISIDSYNLYEINKKYIDIC